MKCVSLRLAWCLPLLFSVCQCTSTTFMTPMCSTGDELVGGECVPIDMLCDGGPCDDTDAGNVACASVNCDDGIGCTDDTCVRGECSQIVNHENCADGDSCTDDVCDSAMGCSNPPLPEYSLCDDEVVATGPDVCRGGTCVGAMQGELDTSAGNFEVVDLVKTTETYVALLNEGPRVHAYAVDDPSRSRSLGSTEGEGHRLRALGSSVYVAAERVGSTSGGLNCNEGGNGPCPLIGVYTSGGMVQWNGTVLHSALNDLAMSSVHDIGHFTDSEQVICPQPPCYSDRYWWFAGRRLGANGRPHVVHCLEQNPSTISCQVLSDSYDKGLYDGAFFVGAEISTSGTVFDPEYNAGVFGLNEGAEGTVLFDFDADPDDALGEVRQGPFGSDFRGSFMRACNQVVQYGDGAALVCEASNSASQFGCTADTNWACSEMIAGNNFVHGTVAGSSLLVTPTALFVRVTGPLSDSNSWTSIDFGLDASVQLAAAAGDRTEWYVLANDTNTGKVKVFRFVW